MISFRLVYDTDTGRPKGFGFAEFADSDAAASAVRNLDKYPVQGRELRVDYSHVGGKDDNNNTNNSNFQTQSQQPINGLAPPQAGGSNPAGTSNLIGPLPMGAELPPGLTCPDAISKTLSTLPAPQLLDILSQMKSLAVNDPMRASELLKQAPQLSYAIFQALLLMGLVDQSLISKVVESTAAAVSTPAPPQPPNLAPMPTRPYQQQQPQYSTPPVQGNLAYQPPAPQPTPQQQAPPIPSGQEELIRQLLAMPQSEIDKLGPAERAQVMILRSQFGGGGAPY